MNSENKKMLFGAFTVIAVGIMLPITIFMVNRPQDIRQQASNNLKTQTLPSAAVPGCPETNADKTVNICRPQLKCPLGETVKIDGSAECTSRLQKPSICCIHI